MSPRVVLVGPPGAGKTTIGKLLAERLGERFHDSDDTVVERAGKPIAEIFAGDGEAHFRELEEQAIASELAGHGGVLALGGGAVLSPRTQERLSGHAVIFLEVGMPEGVRRAGMSTARPLLAGVNPRATYKALLNERLPIYRSVAAAEVSTDKRTPEQVVAAIIEQLDAIGQDEAPATAAEDSRAD